MRDLLDAGAAAGMLALIDAEIARRLPDTGPLVIDPAVLTVALPLSGKPAPEGLRVFPRGSVVPVEPVAPVEPAAPIEQGTILRFFTYWRETSERTDFDLSCVFADENFAGDSHVSYTALRNEVAGHSGDVTAAPAPDGASEFINVHLDRMGRGYVIPQVYVFSGEGFDEVAENFFGFMTLREEQMGAPFEPRLVRAKSALRGTGRTAVPLVFYLGEDGCWYAKWLHLYLRGEASWSGGIRVEENKPTVKALTRAVLIRDYLRVGYLADMLARKARETGPVTYLGITEPEDGLPAGSVSYTLGNLAGLIPA